MNASTDNNDLDMMMDTDRDPVSQYDWQYVIGIVREHKRELILANVIAVIATIASAPLPLLLPLLVDEVLLNQPAIIVKSINSFTPESWHVPSLYILTVLLITLFLRMISLVLYVWQTRQFTYIAKDLTYRIRHSLLTRLGKISMSEYETLGSGTVASYFVTDMETIDGFVGSTISKLLIAILSILGIGIILLLIHWQLALFIMFANPVVIYFTTILGNHVKDLKKKENSAFSLFQQSLTETLDSIHQIRASNRECHYIRQIIGKAHDVKEYGASFAWKSDAASRLSFVIFLFGIDIFRAISMVMVLVSDLSIGQMFAVFGYLWFMMGPVQELLSIQYAFYSANAALERINRLQQLVLEPVYPHLQNPFKNRHTVGIRIEALHFAYGNGPDILNGIDLSIEPGEKIALVGASGGGKSTLVQVLIGLYPARSGTVYFDNIPVSQIGLDVIREHVATVLQHPALFNDSIRTNLTLGKDLPDNRLWHALEIAQLRETVEMTTMGLDTIIGRQGVRLSGGQRQRLAIARMILAEPGIVILDEATSSLDTETEYQLHTALDEFLRDRTTLIVAHRLSAIKNANRVYVFESGTICEQGSHQELLLQNGLYSKLYGTRQSMKTG